MYLKKLHFENIRNHISTDLEFNKGINVLHGLNGSGKTSILEVINIASVSKSFMSVSEANIIRNGQDYFQCSAEAESDLNSHYKISIRYLPGKKKQISSSIKDNLNPKDILGEIPIVVLSPENKSITSGSPEERRLFMDKAISQASKIYTDNLIDLKKCLKHRNNLLNNAHEPNFDMQLFDIWTEQLIKLSAAIVHKRKKFIDELEPNFLKYYELSAHSKEEPEIIYNPDQIPLNESKILLSKDNLIDYFHQIAKKLKKDEFRRGRTLFGPQKDDVLFKVNDGIAKDYASQGQHKSLLISLKFAEFEFLYNTKKETPLFLIDDIFSELDDIRIKLTLDILSKNQCQTFISLTNCDLLKDELINYDKVFYYFVENGKVKKEN